MPESIKHNRLISLDVFRGITIAGMVLVNNPGTWSAIYDPLEHAEWNGWTPTDLVFPFFLFIVGVAITLALGSRVDSNGVNREIYVKIFRRAALIFIFGLLLSTVPFYNFTKGEWIDLSTVRLMGVLQRIAVCYLISAIIFVNTNWKQQAIIAVALLFAYWALMTLIPVPGCEISTFDDKACNLAAYLDRTILGEGHIWRSAKVYDPEGLLSTIPAIATTIAGILTGHWLRKSGPGPLATGADQYDERDRTEKVAAIFFFGIVLITIGWIWNFWFPINKSLWTSSYVVFTAGMALCFLGFCYWLIDIKGYTAWTKPFVIFGVNALALFIGSGLMARIMGMIRIPTAEVGKTISLQQWIFNNIFLPFAEPINASLAYAICFILLWLFLMWLLYRKRIYIRV
jgi:predicted acyltransferase